VHTVTAPGRWGWRISGLVTATALAIPGAWLIARAGIPANGRTPGIVTRTVTVTQPVTSVSVRSYGAPVRVTGGPGRHVRVTETLTYNPRNGAPAVTQSVSGGRLTLADPACDVSVCSVSFALTVPRDVAITAASEGGAIDVSGIAAANLDSGGAVVRATRIDGPLDVTTEDGPLILNGLTGPLHADTNGGTLRARDVAAATVMVITGGGGARIAFTTAPDSVIVSTDGGAASLTVPGGPYALTADSGAGHELVGIATNPAARRSITVSSGGGPLWIQPATAGMPALPANPPGPPFPPAP